MTSTHTPIHRAGRLASGAVLVAAAIAALLVLAPAIMGWERYAIVSGSMSGTYDRGSLVLADVVPVEDLEVGDVITYLPPPGAGPDHLITHRIAWIGRDGSGARSFRTKGDANAVADPWTFRLGAPTQARVRVGVPYAGHLLHRARPPRRAHDRHRAAGPAHRRLQPRPPVAPARRGRPAPGAGSLRMIRAALFCLALLAAATVPGTPWSGADFTAGTASPPTPSPRPPTSTLSR